MDGVWKSAWQCNLAASKFYFYKDKVYGFQKKQRIHKLKKNQNIGCYSVALTDTLNVQAMAGK